MNPGEGNALELAARRLERAVAQLEQKLAAVKAATPDFPAVVRGDSQTQYQAIMDVLDVLGRVGITQVGLATKPAGK